MGWGIIRLFRRQPPETGDFSQPPKNLSKKKAVIWLTVFFLVSAGVFVWYRFFSPEGREQLKYELFQKFYIEPYERAMKEDVYGGKTPEETLRLFIEALKRGDIELASKYFALETNEKSEYYLTRRRWEEGLRKKKEKNEIEDLITFLERAEPTRDQSSVLKDVYWYSIYDSDGNVEYDILFKLNPYSGVWKIESM